VLSRYGIVRLLPARPARGRRLVLEDVREGIGVGVLGGFTTFSTFSVQIVMESDAGETGTAAAAAGYALGRAYS
jgi:fluoride ion exporter CrcB/FEX